MCACLGELFLMINVFFIFFQMSFSADFKIVDRFCKCARGVAGCAHMAAVFLLAQKEVSPTEMECKWSRRKAPEDDAILTVDKIYQRKRKFEPNYGPVPRETFETRTLSALLLDRSSTPSTRKNTFVDNGACRGPKSLKLRTRLKIRGSILSGVA